MQRAEAINIIRSNAPEHCDRLIAALRPSVRIRTQRVELSQLPLGASRFGGCPDVPVDFEWPRWVRPERKYFGQWSKYLVPWSKSSSDQEVFLNFIAQIRLEDLPEFEHRHLLPAQGILYFFYDVEDQFWGYDPADRGGSRVIYLGSQSDSLRRIHHPRGRDMECQPCQVSFIQNWTLPDLEGWTYQSGSEQGWAEQVERGDNWFDLLAELCQQLRDPEEGPLHRLLGHPDLIQGDMQLECQLASHGIYCGDLVGYQSAEARKLKSGAGDWRLLLQVDTDEEGPGWMWGDMGILYYWIRKQDLERQRFDTTWLVLQCC